MRSVAIRPLSRLAALATLAVVVLGLQAPPASAFTTYGGVRLNAVEARLASLINSARAARGLPQLTVTPGTTDVARRWSGVQATRNVLFHNPTVATDISRAGSPSWTTLAENVGRGWEADSLFNAYMNSPGHRANILNRSMRYLGIGWVERADGSGYNTQVFTNQYTSTYGPTRIPAYGGRTDRYRFTASGNFADFERGTDPRALGASMGTGITVGPVAVEPAGIGDQGARLGIAERGPGTGSGADLRLRDSVDLTNVREMSMTVRAITKTGRPLNVELWVRTTLGGSVRVGAMSVPHGATVTQSFPMPAGARNPRNEISVHVPRPAFAALDPWSYTGRAATLIVKNIGVTV